MDVVVVPDPLAAFLAAPEGRYEYAKGSLVEMAPPPSFDHNDKTLLLAAVLRAYAEHHDLGRVVGDNFALHLGETIRAPDVAFFKNASLDRIRPNHCEGGADVVVEIVSPSSGASDRGEKFDEYEAAGVEEYWIVDPQRRLAEFYRLKDGLYTLVLPDAEVSSTPRRSPASPCASTGSGSAPSSSTFCATSVCCSRNLGGRAKANIAVESISQVRQAKKVAYVERRARTWNTPRRPTRRGDGQDAIALAVHESIDP